MCQWALAVCAVVSTDEDTISRKKSHMNRSYSGYGAILSSPQRWYSNWWNKFVEEENVLFFICPYVARALLSYQWTKNLCVGERMARSIPAVALRTLWNKSVCLKCFSYFFFLFYFCELLLRCLTIRALLCVVCAVATTNTTPTIAESPSEKKKQKFVKQHTKWRTHFTIVAPVGRHN